MEETLNFAQDAESSQFHCQSQLAQESGITSDQPIGPNQQDDLFKNETFMDQKNNKRKRICLIGELSSDPEISAASKVFGVPVLLSETGKEFLGDASWITYFILLEFTGPAFDEISRSPAKHKILGPPALIAASKIGDLPLHNRPIYNYAMRGVVTAFTGIRKKDELTHLVYLIHFMGGSIRKDMNHRATHLICSNAFGEKYRYALTFRLNVVRSSWVLDAWSKRNDADFSARNEPFTTDHRLKIFEGCRVAFIGFPEHEKLNMVELLRSYNGIETTSEDESCTHKIIADCPVFSNEGNNATFDNSTMFHDDMDKQMEDYDDDKNDQACQVIQRKHESYLRHLEQCKGDVDDLPVVLEEDETTKSDQLEASNIAHTSNDGAVLRNEERTFSNPQNLSPILKFSNYRRNEELTGVNQDSFFESSIRENVKRKRVEDDSFGDISFMSIDSSKKLKLTRAGSLKKSLGRRMSFGIVQPINKLFSRKHSADPNSSSCSNFETTFNESIKEPLKEKFRQIKDKVSKLSKKDMTTPKSTKAKLRLASSSLSSMKDICSVKQSLSEEQINTPDKHHEIEFKTPKAKASTPFMQSSHFASNSFKSRAKFEVSEKFAETEADLSNAAECKSVVDESTTRYDYISENEKFYVVKSEWFWTRIAEGYAPEDDFLYKDYMQSVKDEQAEQCERRDSLINYSAKAQRKRKRLSRIVLEGTPASTGKRRSSISDAGILSESLIDYTASPEKNDSCAINEDTDYSTKKFSMRHNHFMDFYQTELNYVGILETIVKLFKHPLEKIAEEDPETNDFLNKSELKAIFGNFLPIYLVHKSMLNSLQEINASWEEDSAIGQIIIDNRDKLIKAYPPYVNFFEQMKATLIHCVQSKPRFQAFLKINQAKPECGRQSLQDLMIRPVQRLPSISLLLNDILKHTVKSNRDHNMLGDALRTIKEVMTYINEDKRKTEGQQRMFNIFNEIENCPAHLISSHRSFVSRCEVNELSESLSGRGDSLLLFLFTDTLEVCKKRSKYNTTKSPNTLQTRGNTSNIKPYKHIKMIPLSSIRTLADIKDSSKAFAICLKNSMNNQDVNKDKLYSFSISDEEVDKTMYLKSFCNQMAENACRADAEKFVVTVESQEIGIDTNDVNLGTLSKAFRLATRTRLKVGRAFSFSKTPSRKRTIASPFGSNVSLTPSTISSMSHLKLQSSCMTLNEFDVERKESKDQMKSENLPPLTDQMSRKNKTAVTVIDEQTFE